MPPEPLQSTWDDLAKEKKHCPRCDIDAYGYYCHTCGTGLVPCLPNSKCSNCEKEVCENDTYCKWCGTRV